MTERTGMWLGRFAATALAVAVLGSLPANATEPARTAQPLERSASASALAAHGPLMAVGQAGKRLVAVGERGHVLLSDDGGATWRQSSVPVSTTLTAVSFADERTGVAVGHGAVILRTQDGGATWTKVLDGRAIAQRVLGSVDRNDTGALEEARRLVADGPDKPLLDVRFADAKRALAVGAYGLVLATEDAGATWTTLTDSAPAKDKRHLYAAMPVNAGWYLAGEQGALYRSEDAGRTFARLKSPYQGSFFGLLSSPAGELIAYGLRGNAYRTTDAGASWERVAVPTKASLLGATVLADRSLLLFDEVGGAWRSTDGRNFQAADVGARFPALAAQSTGRDHLVAVGPRGVAQLIVKPSP